MSEKFTQQLTVKNVVIVVIISLLSLSTSYLVITQVMPNNDQGLIDVLEQADSENEKFEQIKEEIKQTRLALYSEFEIEIELAQQLGRTTDPELNREYTLASLKIRQQELENKQRYVQLLEQIDCVAIDSTDQCETLKKATHRWLEMYQDLHAENADFTDGYTQQESYKDELLTRQNMIIEAQVFPFFSETEADLYDVRKY